jgi:hypothetical protein
VVILFADWIISLARGPHPIKKLRSWRREAISKVGSSTVDNLYEPAIMDR